MMKKKIYGLLLAVGSILYRDELDTVVYDNTIDGGIASILNGLSGLGVIIAVLVILLAFQCTVRSDWFCLRLYGAFLALLAVLLIGFAVSAFAYRTSLVEKFDQALNKSMVAYVSPAHHPVRPKSSYYIDKAQSYLGCCGNTGYTDWLSIPKDIPLSCCKDVNKTCDTKDMNEINTQGCFTGIVYLINGTLFAFLGFTFIPFVGSFLACRFSTMNEPHIMAAN
ncbi:tetraspanin-6 isoform X2 [Nomia melanderi]|uniref:tetraspanin-6 isoform X2 n=1 Tax=Nomia melanderi TaxID=2448451 RepID=UPI0013041379|nr:tetraspanin-6-like isoform X2 [Nomia melanderi]